MRMNIRNENGVTLLVLVVTIIIMIIIAAISINYGLSPVHSTKDTVVESNLHMIQQKVLEEYSKKNLNGEAQKYLGKPLTFDEVQAIKDSETIALLKGNNRTNYENMTPYYKLTADTLKSMGVEVQDDQEYLVDYENGEIWDITNKFYQDGETYAYLSGITNSLDTEEEKNTNSPIIISIAEDLAFVSNKYILKLKVSDETAKIASDAWGVSSISVGDTKISNAYHNNVTAGNVDEFSQTEITAETDTNGEYIYTIVIPKTAFTSTGNSQELTISIKKDTIIDANGDTNAATTLKTAYLASTEPSSIDWSLSNYPTYGTKNGINADTGFYVDPDGNTWGTEASVGLTLSAGSGLKHMQYIFQYYWAPDGVLPANFDSVASDILLYPEAGATTVSTNIYINNGTGKGKLYVKPKQGYTGLNTPALNIDYKSVSVNLDNTPPRTEEHFFSELEFWGLYNPDYLRTADGTIISTKNFYALRFIDEESGIRKMQINPSYSTEYTLKTIDGVTKADLDSGVLQNDERLMDFFSNDFLSGGGYIGFINSQLNSHRTYLDIDASFLHGDRTSDSYYLYKLKCNETDPDATVLSDNVGNMIDLPIKQGPFNIDAIQPKIDSVYIDQTAGVGKIRMIDDYSGVASGKASDAQKNINNLKKIKYKWVKNEDSSSYDTENSLSSINADYYQHPEKQDAELTSVNTDASHVSYSQENDFGNYNYVTITVDPPTQTGKYRLYVYAADYRDVAQNVLVTDYTVTGGGSTESNNANDIIDAGKISAETLGYATDLDITVTEPNGISFPSALNIKITSRSNGTFALKRVYLKYTGTTMFQDILQNEERDDEDYYITDEATGDKRRVSPDKDLYMISVTNPDHYYYTERYRRYVKNGSATFIASSVVNGPIEVCVVDFYDNEYSVNYTVGKVQETQVVYNAESGKEYEWPYDKNEMFANISYIDWGDGSSGYFVDTQTRVYIMQFNNSTNHENNISKHTSLSNDSNRVLKISGNFCWDWSGGRGKYKNERVENLALGITEVKQFGIHKIQGASYAHANVDGYSGEHVQYLSLDFQGFDGSAMFCGCVNLTKLPSANEINKNAFKSYDVLYATFQNTGIDSFDVKFLQYANNIFCYDSLFEDCKNLKRINENIFQNGRKKLLEFDSTFKNSGLEEIPADLFKNLEVKRFYGTFFGTKITYIPDQLFNYYHGIEKFDSVFSKIDTLVNSETNQYDSHGNIVLPENLFADQTEAKFYFYLFSGDRGLTYVPENLFKDSPDAYDFYAVFSQTGLEEIPENLFLSQRRNHVKKVRMGHAFQETHISEIPTNLFNGLGVETFEACFDKCKYLKGVDSSIFANVDKSDLVAVSHMFDECGAENGTDDFYVTGNLFENSPKLTDAMKLFCNTQKIKRVDGEIFKNCTSLQNIGAMFFGTNVSYVNPALFDYSKNSINNITWTITNSSCTWVTYMGVFSNCPNLTTCPDLWNRTKFPNIAIYENYLTSFLGVYYYQSANVMAFYNSNPVIQSKITDSTLYYQWCSHDYGYDTPY